MDCYIVKNEDGKLQAIYQRDNNIYFREKTDDSWTYPEIIGNNARKNFTLTCADEVFAVYQTASGDIALGAKGKKPRILLKSKESKNIIIHYIMEETQNRLIYNSPYGATEDYMTEQHQREDKSWSGSIAVDNYIPSSAKLINMGKGKNIMFYIKKVPEYQLGYREITPKGLGRFKLIYATGYKIADYSVALTEDIIHIGIIANGRRSSRLIYLRKDISGTSKPMVLWEGIAELCVTGIIKNKLYIWWKTSRGIYKTVSLNSGDSFKRAEICYPSGDCKKAVFINKGTCDPDKIILNDMFVHSDRVYECMLL